MDAEGPRQLDRYAIFEEIAAGGMATVHLGRLAGGAGFSRTVAIKRMHPHLAREEEFVSMFLDEARLAARIRHPNVVPIVDVISVPGELALVMEFVQGESLWKLMKRAKDRGERIDPRIAAAITASVLHGLHAAHEATSEGGEPLGIVHRDVSPANVLVGADGVTRVVDFGIAKARGRLVTTREGQLKGKITYMSPEQALGEQVDRRTDVFAVGILLWEMLTGRRLLDGEHEAAIIARLLTEAVPAPSRYAADLAPLDALVLCALAREPGARFPTCRAMVVELERICPLATTTEVGAWVERLAGDTIASRAERVQAVERSSLRPEALVDLDDAPTVDDHATRATRSDAPPRPAPTRVPTRAGKETRVLAEDRLRTASQVSSISVAGPTTRPPPPQRSSPARIVAIALAAALGGGALALWIAGARTSSPPVVAASVEPSATEAPPAPASVDTPRAAPPPASAAEPVETASASASAATPRSRGPKRGAAAAQSAAPRTPREKPTDYGF